MEARLHRFLLAFIAASLLGAILSAAAAPPSRIKDTNALPITHENPATSFRPAFFFTVGEISFFTARTSGTGHELWRTDGTTEGTWLLKDIAPGSQTSMGYPAYFTVVEDGTVYFVADDATHGKELWKSDGTTTGTRLVRDINPGPASSNTGYLHAAVIGNTLYFDADDGVHGHELWRTDSTTETTEMVSDMRSGSGGSDPRADALAGTLYISADDGVHGREVWRSDGTPAGTHLLADINPGAASSSTWHVLVAFDEQLFFSADDGIHGRELWRTDGTPAGTNLLLDINPGGAGTTNERPVVFNERLIFSADDGVHGFEPWQSDGTSTGTSLLADINPGSASASVLSDSYLPFENRLYFAATTAAVSRALWSTDGTTAGTAPVSDSWVGTESSKAYPAIALDDALLVVANNGVDGWTLWRTDGTTTGATLVRDFSEAPSSEWAYPPYILARSGNQVLLVESEGEEYWLSDGTTAGTFPTLTPVLLPVSDKLPMSAAVVNGNFVFGTDDSVHGHELWRSDGTVGGAALLKDISSGTNAGELRYFARDGEALYFWTGYGESEAQELWHSDGTLSGTDKLAENAAAFPATASGIAVVDGTLFFAGHKNSAPGYALWTSDGTVAGTHILKEFCYVECPEHAHSSSEYTVVGDEVYFARNAIGAPPTAEALWRTDGTGAGTSPIVDANAAPIRWAHELTAADGQLYFQGYLPDSGYELWLAAGGLAMPLGDINPGPGNARPRQLTWAAGTLFFHADDSVHGSELWKRSGTSMQLVKDIRPGPSGSLGASIVDVPPPVSVGGIVYFLADDGVHGRELWRSDGSAAGTYLIRELASGPAHANVIALVASMNGVYLELRASGVPDQLWRSDGTSTGTIKLHNRAGSVNSSAIVGDTLYFSAQGAASGDELWYSDGTIAGTMMVHDAVPGEVAPSNLLATSQGLYFVGYDEEAERELWHYDLDADSDGLRDQMESLANTGVLDADTDDDGLADGIEDSNHNGAVDPSETDPTLADTDGDGLQDGTESGITSGVPDPDGDGHLAGTALSLFIADADPQSKTSPLSADSDHDGLNDGFEDSNANGRVDAGESDPGAAAATVVPMPAWSLWLAGLLLIAIHHKVQRHPGKLPAHVRAERRIPPYWSRP